MIKLPMLNIHITVILLILLLLCSVLQLYSLQYKIIYRIRVRSSIINGIFLLLDCIVFGDLLTVKDGGTRVLEIIFTVLFVIVSIFSYIYDKREKDKTIHEKSIQEGFDSINTGLCFFDVDGHPILINKKMNEISQLLIHSDILNGHKFIEFVEGYDDIESGKRLKTDDLSMIQLNNGTIYGFHCERIFVDNQIIYQLIATDVTLLYELNESIKKDNDRLSTMNERLKKYNQDVSRLTEKEEILSAKMNIHNELGQALLTTSHYLMNHNQDKDELLNMWKSNIQLLKNEKKEKEKETLNYLYEAGKAIGIDVVIDGDVSDWSQRAIHIFNLATKESMTNAIKHAQASRLYISLDYSDLMYHMTFKNDGKECEGVYVEGGGLSSLRSRVEENGGDMHVSFEGHFEMKINLPG